MKIKAVLFEMSHITVKLLIVSIFVATPYQSNAQDMSQRETLVDINEFGDNPTGDLIVDETKIQLNEKEEIAGILGELRKLKHQVKTKTVSHKLKKNLDRKLANIKTSPLSARLLQAKELMGKEYRSYFKVAKLVKSPDRHIHDYVKESFSDFDKKTRSKARDTSRAILSESKKYGFDPFFLLAVIENESRFNLKARGDAGEIGLMQILPDTAKWICEKNNWKWKGEKTLLDPVQNVKIGAAYLNMLRTQFESSSQLYISAYNMGAGNVYKALSHQVTPKDYHSKVLEFYISYYRQIKKEFERDT